jgi:hypothetical protein
MVGLRICSTVVMLVAFEASHDVLSELSRMVGLRTCAGILERGLGTGKEYGCPTGPPGYIG